MRHHFGDLLNREGDHWTTIPNRERYAHRIGDVPSGSKDVTIITIGKEDENWLRVLTFPNLQELTLHEPSKEQLEAVNALRTVKRLRITHARPKSIEFIRPMIAVEELVLEYVSGFNDLSPLQSLKQLRSLHIENLQRVSSFAGLAGVNSLQYLSINGTLDWNQPIADFEFLRGLPALEVLALWQFITRKPYPALLPILRLRNLKTLRIHGSYLAAEEFALMEEGLKDKKVEGAIWGPQRTWASKYLELPSNDIRAKLPVEVIREKYPEVLIRYDGKREIEDPSASWFEFTGKKAGRIKCDSPNAELKCLAYAKKYDAMKQAARELIDKSAHH